MRDSVNSSMFLVAERRFVGSTAAGAETPRSWIVLDNKIVPVHQPQRAVGAYFAVDGRCPFVVTGGKAARVVGDEISTAPLEVEEPKQVSGGFSDELRLVPIILWKGPRGVDATARARRVAPMEINLPHLLGDGIKTLAVCDGFQPRRRPTVHRFVVAVRNGHVHARVAVGRGADD